MHFPVSHPIWLATELETSTRKSASSSPVHHHHLGTTAIAVLFAAPASVVVIVVTWPSIVLVIVLTAPPCPVATTVVNTVVLPANMTSAGAKGERQKVTGDVPSGKVEVIVVTSPSPLPPPPPPSPRVDVIVWVAPRKEKQDWRQGNENGGAQSYVPAASVVVIVVTLPAPPSGSVVVAPVSVPATVDVIVVILPGRSSETGISWGHNGGGDSLSYHPQE